MRDPRGLGQSENGTSRKIHYIKGTRVAFRAGPGTNHPVLDRSNTGRALELLRDDENGWSHFRDRLTRREGWVATVLTRPEEADAQAGRRKEKSPSQPTSTAPVKPALSRAAIVKAIIADSRATMEVVPAPITGTVPVGNAAAEAPGRSPAAPRQYATLRTSHPK